MEITIKTGGEKYDFEAYVRLIGVDLLVAIYGGDRAHIGAVAAAHPRASLKDPEQTSATASVLCFSGHKEDEIVKTAAEALASRLNVNTVVTAGIHWDHIDARGIAQVIRNNKLLIDRIIEAVSPHLPPPPEINPICLRQR